MYAPHNAAFSSTDNSDIGSEVDKGTTCPCPCDPCDCQVCNCPTQEEAELHETYRDSEVSETDSDFDDDSDECETQDDSDGVGNDENSCVLRGKWMYDGSTSLEEMIDALHREIALLEDLQRDGWVLVDTVHDDFAYLCKDDKIDDTIANDTN